MEYVSRESDSGRVKNRLVDDEVCASSVVDLQRGGVGGGVDGEQHEVEDILQHDEDIGCDC